MRWYRSYPQCPLPGPCQRLRRLSSLRWYSSWPGPEYGRRAAYSPSAQFADSAKAGPALTAPVQTSSPLLYSGGFFFWLWRVRKAVVVEAGAPWAEPADKIWRPIAARTFFQGPGGYCS